jgi:hypothetical protein
MGVDSFPCLVLFFTLHVLAATRQLPLTNIFSPHTTILTIIMAFFSASVTGSFPHYLSSKPKVVTLFHIQSGCHLLCNSSWTAWPLTGRKICCPTTSVTNYKPLLCNIPERQRPLIFKGLMHITISWHSKFIRSPLKSLALCFCILLEEKCTTSSFASVLIVIDIFCHH